MAKIWDNNNLKKLKNLLEKGLSTSEIGKNLGFSKNAVIGKLNRLGWNMKAQKETSFIKKSDIKKSIKKNIKPKITLKSEVKDLTKKDSEIHKSIVKHSLQIAKLKSDECRWPIGDPNSDNFHFCGCKVFTGKPYCYEHCKIAYQFTQPKRK